MDDSKILEVDTPLEVETFPKNGCDETGLIDGKVVMGPLVVGLPVIGIIVGVRVGKNEVGIELGTGEGF